MKSLHLLACAFLGFTEGLPAAEKPYTIAVIPKGTTHEFWKSINAGAFKARDELAAQGFKVDVIWKGPLRSEEHTSELQSLAYLVCRLLLEKKKEICQEPDE